MKLRGYEELLPEIRIKNQNKKPVVKLLMLKLRSYWPNEKKIYCLVVSFSFAVMAHIYT